ncbi:MAG TPA: HAD family hydrolase [Jiangellaceae bacterium]
MNRSIPRLVATDLDGTLLRSDTTVSARTIAALRGVEAAGGTVVLVTGRPVRSMRPVAEAVGHTGLAVCANGAVVVDLHDESIVETYPLDPAAAFAVVEAVRATVPEVTFAVETTAGFAQEPGYPTHPLDARTRLRTGAIDDLIDAPVIKLIVRHEQIGADELMAAITDVAGSFAEITHSSHIGLLEVSGTGVTKASTLAVVAGERGIDAADVVAFGDMPNDLPMLAWAGRSYAMANAHRDVLAAVEQVAPVNDDDGVAQVLEELFDLPAGRS